MTNPLAHYESIVGKDTIRELHVLARHLNGVSVQHVNSTYVGGGVAEILSKMVPLLQELGIEARWDVVEGDAAFFNVTKTMHNALHGRGADITGEDIEVFRETSRKNLAKLDLSGDILFVHDPQPIALAEKKAQIGRRWIWRCHIDVSAPRPGVWRFLEEFIPRYDAAVFSAPQFARPLPIPQFQIAPSIDPLSMKNRDLPQETVDRVLVKYGIERDRPIITQISRFDRLKDPVGVIQVFKMVRTTIPCQLVLAGGGATDDPEGEAVLAEVQEQAGKDPDIHILLLPPGSDLEINAIQRASDVVLQKSLAEGFGLTVSEALWKARPVVASAVGGISLQVRHRSTGLLVHTIEGAVQAVRELLNNPRYARWLGENGREHVRRNFLLTRHLKDYLLLFLSLGRREETVYL